MKTSIKTASEEFSFLHMVVILAWCLFSFSLLKGEWISLQQAPKRWQQSINDKKFASDGPIYLLSYFAREIIPSDATLVFVSSASGGAKEYYEFKLNYYLWPRRIMIVTPQGVAGNSEFKKADYVLFFSSPRTPLIDDKELEESGAFKKLFEYRQNGHYAIYQSIKRGKA